jgi:hypothetical protein
MTFADLRPMITANAIDPLGSFCCAVFEVSALHEIRPRDDRSRRNVTPQVAVLVEFSPN